MNTIIRISVIFILLSFLTGCWDKLELEEQAYVVVIGVDKSDVHEKALDVTIQIANPQVGSTDRSRAEKEPASDILTVTVPDIVSVKDTANAIIARKINFTQLQSFIIGTELAKTEKFANVVSSALRDRQIRREINIMVTEGKASEFIKKNKPKLLTRPHKYYEFMQNRWRDNGMVPYSTFDKYLEQTEGQNSIFLTIYATVNKKGKKYGHEDEYIAGQIIQKGGDPVQAIGAGVIKDGKMIDILTGEETRICLLLRKNSQAQNWLTTNKDPLNNQYRVTTRLLKERNTKIKINKESIPLKIDVEVPVTLQLLAIPSQVDYVKNVENQKILQKSIEDGLNKKTMEFVKKTQEEYHDEPFMWYLEARKNFWRTDDFYNYNWDEKYQNAEINVKYKVTLQDFGKQLKPPKTKTEED